MASVYLRSVLFRVQFSRAIILVAKERKLPSTWLNDDVTIVVDQVGRPKAAKLWKSFALLNVYIPEFEYIFALKCFSGRRTDDRDIQALAQRLHIQTQAEAWSIVNAYIPPLQLSSRNAYTTQAILRCFPS
jgi:hypothetical protein